LRCDSRPRLISSLDLLPNASSSTGVTTSSHPYNFSNSRRRLVPAGFSSSRRRLLPGRGVGMGPSPGKGSPLLSNLRLQPLKPANAQLRKFGWSGLVPLLHYFRTLIRAARRFVVDSRSLDCAPNSRPRMSLFAPSWLGHQSPTPCGHDENAGKPHARCLRAATGLSRFDIRCWGA
jgi:hypothetical protein